MVIKMHGKKQQGCHPDQTMANIMKILIHPNIILLHQGIESETRLYLLKMSVVIEPLGSLADIF